jgi:hypothetical protein
VNRERLFMTVEKLTGTEHTDALYLRGIPHNLKEDYKVWCVINGLSMTEGVARYMQLVTRKGSSIAEKILTMDDQPREFNKPDPPTKEESRD